MKNFEQILSDASYQSAWDIINKYGAFYFVVKSKNGIGHSIYRRSTRQIPEQDVAKIYSKRLEEEMKK